MGKIGFVFSGQGAQYVGMGQELYQEYSIYRKTFDKASEVLGFDIADICFSNEEKLNETEYTQPAILTMSVATSRVIKEELGIEASIVAGLSLGEYSALVESGALKFENAVSLVKKRGKFMTEAVPLGVGAMSAVLGLTRKEVEEACAKASSEGVVIAANYNMPTQISIAGEVKAVEYAKKILVEMGAKRVIRLNVSGPFHTKLLAPAAAQLEKELELIQLSDMSIPVVTNYTGKIIPSKEMILPTLVQQVMSPVYWEDCVETMVAEGVETFIEIGPGKALSGFIRKIAKGVPAYNVESIKTLETLKEKLLR